MIPQVAAGRLAAFCDGRPKLIVLPGVKAPQALALPGLSLWTVRAGEGAPLLHPFGEAAGEAGQPLPAAPGLVLGIVAAAADDSAGLLGWWRETAPAALPPVIEAATGNAAMPAVAARAIAALAASAEEATATLQGLVALREEHEALRVAQAALRLASAHLPPPAPPVLVASAEPSAGGHAVAAHGGRLALGQSLGTKLEGLAAIALHLKEARAGAEAALRIRLIGAESGRIAGAWLLPGRALVAGWLTLDLPEPLGALRETAWLEVAADLGAFDRLALSLSAEPPMPGAAVAVAGAAVAVAGGAAESRALAFGLWTAQPGRRLVQAAYWDAEAIGLSAPPTGVPADMPQQVWQTARVPVGRVERVAIGREPARLVASLAGGEQALVVLPAVPLNGLDLLQAELAVTLGDAAALEAALWLQPEGTTISAEGDLSVTAPGARWSGWHAGAFGEGVLRLALALPVNPPRRGGVAIVLRNRAEAPEAVLRVEIARLHGLRAVQPPPEAARRQPPPLRILPARPAGAPAAAAVRLLERFAADGGNYRHLDLLLEGIRAGEHAWPRLRCKLAVSAGSPVLEIRQRPDWPVVFEHWPPSDADAAGPFLQIGEEALAGGFAARLESERDRVTLATLLRLLPSAVATAARDATTDPEDYERWIASARRLAVAGG
ncbi:DUF6212 domain-containing protein [Paracraurococcus lichenis]|uniref:DUF6212 domain-containing protein n=1 Tax=Paracraurococcus lichenis TaxID=3064888 RepID=A0ABT9E4H1_9PROT|nr:DUF6212 domain-containing protein [Paracraurococcus sp. LOR1-02]MDO9711064.1 DUF6212 domain-containing protein [Paracraurococcus sp. LOR1-02]